MALPVVAGDGLAAGLCLSRLDSAQPRQRLGRRVQREDAAILADDQQRIGQVLQDDAKLIRGERGEIPLHESILEAEY